MMKFKEPKEIILDLPKTYTEIEEAKYLPCKKILISKSLFTFSIIVTVVMLSVTQLCSAWDGAGATWSCSKCGTSNYVWEMSCGNCGESQ